MKSSQKKQKNKIVILSAMRSGSTLLKAILGSARDVSHLPEVDFQKEKNVKKYNKLCEESIIVFKKPAWFNEIFDYPKLVRKRRFKKIILYRNPFDCIYSLKKMMHVNKIPLINGFFNWFLVYIYWYSVYDNLYKKYKKDEEALFISYDDFIKYPVKISKKLFYFIGSNKKSGTDKYNMHQKGWKWGIDDNSIKIKTGKVCNKNKPKKDAKLKEMINNSKKVQNLVKKYNDLL
ncbi:MAG: sulfotransferase family protein [Nanobdellota archaeon]